MTGLIGNTRTKIYHKGACGHLPSTNLTKDLIMDEKGNVYDFKGNLYRPCGYCHKRGQTTIFDVELEVEDEVIIHV